jgi:hypothetical protein
LAGRSNGDRSRGRNRRAGSRITTHGPLIPSRSTTIEVIVAEGLWTPVPPASDALMGVRVAWTEAALAWQMKAVEGQWNHPQQVWDIHYDQVVAPGLVDRIAVPAL